jgi:hypothetical protein
VIFTTSLKRTANDDFVYFSEITNYMTSFESLPTPCNANRSPINESSAVLLLREAR